MNPAYLGQIVGIADLPAQIDAVDSALLDAVASGNTYLHTPALRVVQAGGKRLRPVLTIAAAAAGGGSLDPNVLQGAVAVELVHAGSLVHDDIIDSAEARRGVVTVNHQEGAAHAILVGDFLLARAGEAAAAVSQAVAAELARTLGALCDGQSREVTDAFDAGRSFDAMLAAIRGKTAALLRSACTIGALSARLSDDMVATMADYGEAFGIAFQIIDDILDVVSTQELLGKPVGNDIREGVYTLPVIYAMQEADGDELAAKLGVRINEPERVAEILDLVKASGGVERALEVAREYNEEARKALEHLDQNDTVRGLAHLPDAYLNWAIENKAPDYAVRA